MNSDVQAASDPQEAFREVRHGFTLLGHHLLLPVKVFSEVVSRPRICPIPTTPRWFAGFINHRGETVPVYDVERLIEPENHQLEGKNRHWVLLLDEPPHMAGIILSQPPTGLVAPDHSDETAPNLPEILSPHVRGWLKHSDQLWAEFNHRQFFLALKKQF